MQHSRIGTRNMANMLNERVAWTVGVVCNSSELLSSIFRGEVESRGKVGCKCTGQRTEHFAIIHTNAL